MTFYEKAKLLFESQKLEIDFFCDLKWASTYSEHRIKLRKQIYKQTKNKSVLDLKQRPSLIDQEISISHCPKIGGFVISKNKIGLDLEQYQRLSPNLIQRITTNDELKKIGEDQLQIIWTVKESAFKSSGGLAKLMSEVQILNNKELQVNFGHDSESKQFINLDHSCFITEAKIQDSKFVVYSLISRPDDVCLSLACPI